MIPSLSAREREFVRLTGEGYSASEIAALLKISVKTISMYRLRVLDKLEDAGAITRRTSADIMRYAIVDALSTRTDVRGVPMTDP